MTARRPIIIKKTRLLHLLPLRLRKTQDAASLAELSKRYAGKDVTIIDASEIQLDGANAMVVTFSVPLDPNQDFSQFARLVDVKNGKLEGAGSCRIT